MATVRILHDGGVGEYKAGDVVKNAPANLVHIAESGVRNAADGQLVAEIVPDTKRKSKDGGADGVQSEDSQSE